MSELETAPTTSTAPAEVVIRPVQPHEYQEAGAVLVTAYRHDYTLSTEYLEHLRAIDHWATDHQVWIAVEDTLAVPGGSTVTALPPGSPTGAAQPTGTSPILGLVVTPRPGGPPLAPLARPGEFDFRLLAVHPQARGRGIGELLTRHIIDLARNRGATAVVMNSGPDMRAAHRLYDRLGFERLHEREDRWVPGPSGPIRLLAFGYSLRPHDPSSQQGSP